VEFAQRRLSALSESLGDKPYLDGERFTAGDLMMTTVLRILKHTDVVTTQTPRRLHRPLYCSACLQASAGCSDW
jgi:glutathione S-transferase